jgi:protein-S-isoprenylcysteine O-methyltransferase Ste14
MRIVIFMTVLGGVLFVAAGTFIWLMAWIFLGVYLLCVLISVTLMMLSNPELLLERAEFKPRQGVKKWDVWVSALFRVSFPVTLLISGLQYRFGGQPYLTLWLQILALVMGVLGYFLIAWVLTANRSAAVYTRIQEERGHIVATSGPYRFVRHPFYVGAITIALMIPLALGSVWGLFSGICGAGLMVVKTGMEDRMLQTELEGYPDFVEQVPYRLLPGVW